MMCLLAMMAVSLSAKAQDVTITLYPGWNWISYPKAEVLDVNTALGDFVPMNGDKLQSQFSNSSFSNGQWRGGVTHFMPGWGYKYYSNRTEAVSFVFGEAAPQLTVTTAEPTEITAISAVVGGTVTLPDGCHVFLRGVCWGTEPNLDIDGNHTSDGTSIGNISDTLVGLTPGTTYYVRAYVVTDYGLAYGEELDFTTEHEYVDLGLPSGTLWATCNVGATTPEEYGDYFAWGETIPKETYNWSTYQYCNGSGSSFTKYCTSSLYGYNGFIDNLTTLLLEDDAAWINWGTEWRIPSKEEWQELYQNTTHIWTTLNGVNGRLFTATNGNSLFLPAAGSRNENNINGIGNTGTYWSNSLYGYPYDAWFLRLNSSDCGMLHYYRYTGLSVRAVRPASQNTFAVINVSADPINGGTVAGGGTYQYGQGCTVVATANEGYTFSCWTENGIVISNKSNYTFRVTEEKTLVANFTYNGSDNAPIGAIDHLFSVNDGLQVYFSQGNLQYIGSASTPYWKFAEHQWDYLGTATGQNSENQDVDRDLFGWGTSGYNHGARYYQPWCTGSSSYDYKAYGQFGYSLYDQTGQADWGYNPISNGGNQENMWRTLTVEEWTYVLDTRSTVSGIRYAMATVNNVDGLILLPDDWNASTFSLNATNSSTAYCSYNILTASQWNVLEQAGAVFLPAAGVRGGTQVNDVNWRGYYWSASYVDWGDPGQAYNLMFISGRLGSNYSISTWEGCSVRLVAPVEN